MIADLARILVNTISLVPLKVKIFNRKYPGETVVAAGGSKAICLNHEQEVKRGIQWILSKRAVLFLSDRRLVCGSWNIELNSIANATILKVTSFFVKALILKVETKEGKHYQFGLQYDKKWIEQKVLPLNVAEGKIESSLSSKIFRAVIWAYIIWWLIQHLNK